MGIYDEIADPVFNLYSKIYSPATGLPLQLSSVKRVEFY